MPDASLQSALDVFAAGVVLMLVVFVFGQMFFGVLRAARTLFGMDGR